MQHDSATFRQPENVLSDSKAIAQARRVEQVLEAHDAASPVLLSLQVGAVRFAHALHRERVAVESLKARLRALPAYDKQVRDMQRRLGEIDDMLARARIIGNRLTALDAANASADELRAYWGATIEPLLVREQQRRIREMRVQGFGLAAQTRVETGCGSQHGLAFVRMAEELRDLVHDPQSGLRNLWRWFISDGETGSIWLYHHAAEEKWQCLSFRLKIKRLNADLEFRLEAFVPYGFANDPARYPMETSDVFEREGWKSRAVTSTTINATRTYSLNATEGLTVGTSAGFTYGENVSETESVNDTSSFGTSVQWSDGFAASDSWFDGWSESSSWSGGFASSGSGFGSNRGGGGSSSRSFGAAQSDAQQTAHGTGHSSSTGRSVSSSSGMSESLTRSIGYGFSVAAGESLQVRHIAFGINHGVNDGELLAKWKSGNPAGELYDAIVNAFTAIVPRVASELRENAKGRHVEGPDERELRERLPDIEKLMLVDHSIPVMYDLTTLAKPPLPLD